MLKALAATCRCHARGRETLCRHSAQRIIATAGSTRVTPFRGVDRRLSFSRSISVVRPTTLGADTTLNSQTPDRQLTRCMASQVRPSAHSEPLSTPSSTPVSALYVDHLDPLNTMVVDVDLDLMKRLEDVTTLVDNVTSRGMCIDVQQLVRHAAKQDVHLELVSMISLAGTLRYHIYFYT